MSINERCKTLYFDVFLENILCVTKDGNRIKIIDFGLARKYDPDKKLQVSNFAPEVNYFILLCLVV